MRSRALLLLLAAALAAPLKAQDEAPLEVLDVRWGFEQRLVPLAFQPVAVRVRNASAERFDGLITLKRRSMMGGAAGGMRAQPVSLAPDQARWVAFHVQVQSVDDLGFRFGWRGASAKGDLTLPRALRRPDAGGDALIELSSPRRLDRPASQLRAFPSALFPPTAAAAQSLAGAVLDHQPRWGVARQRAFIDWIRSGGSLLLVDGSEGPVRFDGELSPLNQAGEFALGSGLVRRAPRAAQPLTRAHIERLIGGAREPQIHGDDGLANEVFLKLQRRLRSETSWGLVVLLALVYLVMIFVGGLLIGRRRHHLVLGAYYLILIALFGLGFGYLGARGNGEQSTFSYVGLVRPIDAQRGSAQLYTNAFTILSHDLEVGLAGHTLVDDTENERSMNSILSEGPGGGLRRRLALFSSQPLVLGGVVEVPSPQVTVVRWEPDPRRSSSPGSLELQIADPDPRLMDRCFISWRSWVWKVRHQGGRIVLDRDDGSMDADQLAPHRWHNPWDDADVQGIPDGPEIARFLVAAACPGTHNWAQFADRDPDEARLFLIMTDVEEPLIRHNLEGAAQRGTLVFEIPLRRARK